LGDSIFTRIGRWWDGEPEDTAASAPMMAAPEHISDGWDAPTDPAMAKAASTVTIGSTGETAMGGYILSTERGPRLEGIKRYEAFADLLANTAIVAAGVRLFLALLKKADWAVVAAEGKEDDPRAQELAELVESMMFDMETSWTTMVGKLAMYRFDGHRLLEWTAKRRDDGAIGMADVEGRPPRTISRWDLDEGGKVRGVWQQCPPTMTEVYIPREKLVYGVDDSLTESPEGMGLFRHLVMTARRLKGFHDLEEIGFETDLRGIPVAYGPLGALDEMLKKGEIDKATWTKYRKPLVDFINSHIRNRKSGMMFDSETYRSTDDAQTPSSVRKWGVELLQGESSSFEAMAAAINRLNQEMARVLGVEHLLLGADGGGSLALGRAKIDVLYLMVQSTQSEIVEILERDWLGPIAALNGWDEDLIPSLAVAEMRAEDVAAITEALAQLAQAGAVLMPSDPVVDVVRDMLNLPHAPEERMELDAALLGGLDDPEATEPKPKPGDEDKPAREVEKRARTTRWIKSRRSRRRAMEAAKRAA
jgi:hypothetical protein